MTKDDAKIKAKMQRQSDGMVGVIVWFVFGTVCFLLVETVDTEFLKQFMQEHNSYNFKIFVSLMLFLPGLGLGFVITGRNKKRNEKFIKAMLGSTLLTLGGFLWWYYSYLYFKFESGKVMFMTDAVIGMAAISFVWGIGSYISSKSDPAGIR